MPNEDIQQEWRTLILKKLDHLELGQEGIKDDIQSLRLTAVHPDIIEKLEIRVRELENFKERALTLFFVIQFLIGVGMMIINHYWK